MTRPGTRIVLWAVTAVAATALASLAIGVSVGANQNVLSRDDVARALAADGPADDGSAAALTATPTHMAVGSAAPAAEVVRTTPGTLVVRCSGDTVTLQGWSPNLGYRVDRVVRGPAATASVWFESDIAADVEVVVTCDRGQPAVKELVEPDHGGGGSGSGGGPGPG